MFDKTNSESARQLFDKAYSLQQDGRLEEAIDLYKTSLSLCPTPEAHTFLGWAYSLCGLYYEAIQECKLAIEIDPNYGNPYNDIGSYLISLDRYEEAIPWLKLAIDAENYEPRHYPYFNLGRAYELMGKWLQAREYYESAYEVNPEFEQAKFAALKLTAFMN